MKGIQIAILSLLLTKGFCQDNPLTIEQVVAMAIKQNTSLKAVEAEAKSQQALKKTAVDLPKTEVMLLYGQYNSDETDNNITISQTIPFSIFGSQASLNKAVALSGEIRKTVTENELVFQVKQAFYQLAFVYEKQRLLYHQDSIYNAFFNIASKRYKAGETNLLEQTTAESQWNEVKNQLRQNEAARAKLRTQLKVLLSMDDLPDIAFTELMPLPLENLTDDTALYKSNPSLGYIRQQIEVARREKNVQIAKSAPDLMVGFFTQTLIGVPLRETGDAANRTDRFTGFQIGVSIPLWPVSHYARIRAAEFNKQAVNNNYAYYEANLQSQFQQALIQLGAHANSLEYYKSSALPNANGMIRQLQTAFQKGEIGYAEYLIGIRNATGLQEGYIKTINDYNQNIVYIQYLAGKK
jgi:heavy metal efflux system protein